MPYFSKKPWLEMKNKVIDGKPKVHGRNENCERLRDSDNRL